MPSRALLLTLFALATLAPCVQNAVRVQSQDADPRRIAREILVGPGGYQTELPGAGEATLLDPQHAEEKPKRAGRAYEESAAEPRTPAGADGLGILLWILLAVLVVAMVLAAIGHAVNRGRDVEVRAQKREGTAEAESPPEFDPGALPLDEAERLALEGRFAEAIRILLARTFEALRARGGFPIAPWMTSRELLRRAPLGRQARAALTSLVDAVERSLFGRDEPGREQYAACAHAFRMLQDRAPEAATPPRESA